MLLELGGGTNPHPRADVIIDLHHPKNAEPQDASVTPWKIGEEWRYPSGRTVCGVWGDGTLMAADDSVDEVYASHFMEHVPHGQPLINVMNEAWRVLRPGGTFTMIMPLVGYTGPGGAPIKQDIGWQPWADPTHVSYWWLPEALLYFTEGPFKPAADYGISIWGPLGQMVPADFATASLNDHRRTPMAALTHDSFWSVRQGWEGIARLMKP